MKTLSGIDPERLRQIDPAGISTYLSFLGWQQVDYPDQRVRVYVTPDDTGCTVPVPATRQLKDYVELTDRLLVVLADIEHCAYEDVLQLLCSHSILKLRAADQQATPRGTLPLPSADILIKKAQELITYSTCAETGMPQKHYKKPIRQAREHAEKYELGQTEPGSFIINIITPVRLVIEQDVTRLTDVEPLEHRVLRRIVRGAEIVREAERLSDASLITENYGRGFNANMCDIVADTIEQTGLDELSFSALGVDRPGGDYRQQDILLTKASLPQLEKASVILKDAPVDERVSIVGHVTVLRNEDAPEPGRQRHVQIAWPTKGINVHLILTDEEYVVACDAHRDRRRVLVEGILHHEKRKFYLYDYRHFRIEGADQENLF